jgi:membrane-associated protease RseP (regulator of RpoE activity)
MTGIIIIVVVAISVAVHVLSVATAGSLMGASIEEIKLYSGPCLFRVKLNSGSLYVHAIPLGGSVKFWGELADVQPLKQVFVAVSGTLALLVVAIFVLGISEGLEQFGAGFRQIVAGAFAPSATGAGLIRTAYDFLIANSFFACLGAVAAKMAAGNLLPVPSLAGGDAVLYLLNTVMPLTSETRERIRIVGLLVVTGLFICWLVAIYVFVVTHLI